MSTKKILKEYNSISRSIFNQLILSISLISIIYILLVTPKFFFSSEDFRILNSVSTYNEITLFFSSFIFFIANLFWRYKFFFIFLLLIIFLTIRYGEIYHFKLFGFGYEPITIANMNIESFEIFVKSFFVEIFIIFFVFLTVSFVLLKIKGKLRITSLIVAILMVTRSIFIIDKWLESNKSEKVYAFSSEFSLARAFKNSTLQKVSLNDQELKLLSSIYTSPTRSDKLTIKKNVFLIYLESFSSKFLDRKLTPELYKISRRGKNFTNFFNSVTPTINAIVASQCGVFPNLGFEGVKISKYSNLYCLGDYLKENNYFLSYLQAADKNFANKIDFYHDHHYDRFIGGEEINLLYSQISGEEKIDFWGVNDRQLFEIAKLELEKIKSKSPFLFSLININTHTPGYFSEKCSINEKNRTIKAIKCTDYYLGKFLRFIEMEFPDSLLIIVGDHVAGPNNEARKIVKDEYINTSFDRTIFVILDLKENSYEEIDIFGTTVDFFPTLVETLGGKLNEAYFGKSLISQRRNYQNIITPEFQLSQEYIDFPENNAFPLCFSETEKFSQFETNNCTRRRIFAHFDQNLIFQMN